MSQVDKLNYFPFLFWFILVFLLFYFFVYVFFLPLILTSIHVKNHFVIKLLKKIFIVIRNFVKFWNKWNFSNWQIFS